MTCNPLAYWEFRDCFDFVESNGLEAHPLHAQASASTLVVVHDNTRAPACCGDLLPKSMIGLSDTVPDTDRPSRASRQLATCTPRCLCPRRNGLVSSRRPTSQNAPFQLCCLQPALLHSLCLTLPESKESALLLQSMVASGPADSRCVFFCC